MGAPSNRTATLESQMIPMIQDVPGQTLTIATARGGKIATKTADLPNDVKVVGNPDQFVLLFKAAAPRWSKSTKAMDIGTGCIVQVSTEHLAADGAVSVAEAVTFVPGVQIGEDEQGAGKRLILSEGTQ